MERHEATASVTLLVLGEDLDPELVTRSLLQFPDQAWRRGELHPALARYSIPGHPARWGGWKKFIHPDVADRSIEDQLQYWATSLGDRTNGIAILCSLGYELVLDCTIAPTFPFLLDLSDSLQLQLGALHLNLELHVFDANQPESQER